MLIEIEDKNYKIYPKSAQEGIKIRKIVNDTIHLDVPAHYTQEMLTAYVRNILPKELKSYTKSNPSSSYFSIFGNKYPIRYKHISQAYFHDGIIYLPEGMVLRQKNSEKIKLLLLQNFINSCLSTLEEELNHLLPQISIKPLKKNYFSISKEKNKITYSKKLIEKEQQFVFYIIIKSIEIILDRESTLNLVQKFVANYRHYDKIIAYEQLRIED